MTAGRDQTGSLHANQRAELVAQLAEIRGRRVADEAVAGQLPQVQRAIQLARRERDAGMSPRLRGHRNHLERVIADVEDLLIGMAEASVLISGRGLDPLDPIVHGVRAAQRSGRAAIMNLAQAMNGVLV